MGCGSVERDHLAAMDTETCCLAVMFNKHSSAPTMNRICLNKHKQTRDLCLSLKYTKAGFSTTTTKALKLTSVAKQNAQYLFWLCNLFLCS